MEWDEFYGRDICVPGTSPMMTFIEYRLTVISTWITFKATR